MAAVVLLTATTSSASALPDVVPDFDGKVVVVLYDESTTLENKTDTVLLFSPTVVTLGPRPYIFGPKYRPGSQDEGEEEESSRPPVSTGIACDQVVGFIVFTPEGFEEYYQRRQDPDDE